MKKENKKIKNPFQKKYLAYWEFTLSIISNSFNTLLFFLLFLVFLAAAIIGNSMFNFLDIIVNFGPLNYYFFATSVVILIICFLLLIPLILTLKYSTEIFKNSKKKSIIGIIDIFLGAIVLVFSMTLFVNSQNIGHKQAVITAVGIIIIIMGGVIPLINGTLILLDNHSFFNY